jgi:hypothetical protein
MKSPKETEHYACPSCGNTRSFVGYDAHGYPGPDECECGKNICQCEVTLEQHFIVHEDGSIDYHAFEGGGRGAEIGSYTRIKFAVCKELIWAPTSENPGSISRRMTMTDPTESIQVQAEMRLQRKSTPASSTAPLTPSLRNGLKLKPDWRFPSWRRRTKNRLANSLRVIDSVLLWAHDYLVLPPSFLLFKGTRFTTERKSTAQLRLQLGSS